MTSIKSRLTHNSSLIFRIIILLMAIFNFEMLQCCVITGTGCHRGHHISGLTGCCAIVYMGAAILEQQEQQEKVAYKESFPTTFALYKSVHGKHGACLIRCLTPYPLDGDSATIRNFGQNDTNRSRNGTSAVEAQ